MASRKAALGRGLSALLPDDSSSKSAEDRPDQQEGVASSQLYQFDDGSRLAGQVADVPVSRISPNPYQPRQEFDESALDELAASIEQLGIIQPLTVRVVGKQQFELISGERRLRAAKKAGLDKVPAYVRRADSEGMLEMALVENVQREELNPIEVALGYQRLIDECDLTQAAVAEKVGKGRTTVANMLRLLKLPPEVQAALRAGSVQMGHARALLSLEEKELQIALLEETIANDLSVRAVEEKVRAWHEAAEEPEEAEEESTVPSRDTLEIKAFTDRLRSRLSTQVKINRKSNGEGKIEIAYYSDEDLERLLEIIL